MDRIVLIQSADDELADRLVQWAKRFDLGVTAVRFRDTEQADSWWLRPDARADLALVDAVDLLTPKARIFWTTREGGALPLVAFADATVRNALEWGRRPGSIPESVVRLPPDPGTVSGIVGKPRPGALGWMWDPHGKGKGGPPDYFQGLGDVSVRRSPDLTDLERLDRTRLAFLAAELTAASPSAALEWREWRRQMDLSSIPALTVVGPAFVAALRNSSALAAVLSPEKVWKHDGDWDAQRSELWLEVERFRAIDNFLRGADRFLRRKTPHHAVTSLEHALTLHPNCAALWDRLSDCLLAKGERERAKNALRRAVQLEPGHRERWTKLADLTQSGDDQSHVALLREGAVRFPWDFELRERLGDYFLRRGDRAASGIELGRARLLRP